MAGVVVGWVVIVGISTQGSTTNIRDMGRACGTDHREAGIVFFAMAKLPGARG